MRNAIVYIWEYIFDHQKSPLRNIDDFGVRHMVFQLLGWMWALSFSIAIGSYTLLALSMLGHAVLISAAAITVATYTVAAKRPRIFLSLRQRKVLKTTVCHHGQNPT